MSENENQEPEEQPEETKAEEPEQEAPDLDISVGVENGKVFVQFSQRLSIVAMPPESAEQMADALKKHAAEARQLAGE